MKTTATRLILRPAMLLGCIAFSLVASRLCAQVVNDGATVTLNNVTNTIIGDVTVGTNGDFTLLILTNKAFLTNSGNAFIGKNAGANSNTVSLVGTNTRWFIAGNLFVGSNGAFNRLIISNGATVSSDIARVGAGTNSSNNLVIVTGAGALWSNTVNTIIGDQGSGNQLIVNSGGDVMSASGVLGNNTTSDHNSLLIDGSGSSFISAADMAVGNFGSSNLLVVTNGGLLVDDTGKMGAGGPGSNNVAIVTGAGSLWSNQDALHIGFNAGGQTLLVSNGGTVFASNDVAVGTFTSGNLLLVSAGALVTNEGNGVVGFFTNSISNTAFLSGTNSRWLMGGSLFVGSNGSLNTLVISNGAAVVSSVGTIGGGGGGGAASNQVIVTGASSVWSNRNSLSVGPNGDANSLVVANGGTVITRGLQFGISTGASGNSLLVTGAGSLLSNQGLNIELNLGNFGSSNQVRVTAGGRLESSEIILGGDIAFDSGGSNNSLIVDGSNSVVAASGFGGSGNGLPFGGITVGQGGASNLLIVTNGAMLQTFSAVIGSSSNAHHNSLILSGNGSVWSNKDFEVTVGGFGASNRLIIENGAKFAYSNGVTFSYFTIGDGGTADGNIVSVTGPGSRMTLDSLEAVRLGLGGSANQLIVSNGGFLDTSSVSIGSTGVSNLVIVTGTNSVWTNSAATVGDASDGNGVIVTNGGTAFGFAILGNNASASSNFLLVTGSNSVFTGTVHVGFQGAGNRLVVSNGGTVRSPGATLGVLAVSSNNQAIVTGAGSLWSNTSSVDIGESGSGSLLVVSNGGVFVTIGNVLVGATTNSSNNRIVVDGGTLRATNVSGTGTLDLRRGTTEFNAGLIDVDRLVMTNAFGGVFDFNGGTLITRGAVITNDFDVGTGGTTPAVWDVRASASNQTVSGTVEVGISSPFNQLLITNGARLSNGGTAFIGIGNAAAASNTASVSGSGSQWLIGGDINVGRDGPFSRLVVSNGALVTNQSADLGFNPLSGSNVVVVTGAGSTWRSGSIDVGTVGSGNMLIVSNGGLVAADSVLVGNSPVSSNNTVIVTGAGSLWSNRFSLIVGLSGDANQLLASNGGTVFASNSLVVGANSSSVNDRVTVGGGTVRVANAATNGTFDIRRGTNQFNAGVIDVDQLLLTNSAGVFEFNGGTLITRGAFISNGVLFAVGATGATPAVWDVRAGASPNVLAGQLRVGSNTSFNQLLITNGALLTSSSFGVIGLSNSANSNAVIVSGAGSRWLMGNNLLVGDGGAFNRLVVSNGALVGNVDGQVGFTTTSSNNEALVTGGGALWSNQSGLFVGFAGSGSRVVVSNGGTVFASNGVFVGLTTNSTNNRLIVDGGTLRSANPLNGGVLDVRRGTNVFNAGLIDVNGLLVTNTLGVFEFNGGTLVTAGTTNANGRIFTVGNGTSAATLQLAGGTHVFSNNLVIASNAALTGTGTILGNVTNFGSMSAGSSPGSLTIDGNLRLQPSASMTFEIGGLIPTNQFDQITVTNFVEFAGTLSLTLINNYLPNPGDTFTLMQFATATGTFSNAAPGGRVSITNNLASFAVNYSLTNVVIGSVQYVDSDGDGEGDLQEQAAGTNPNDSTSVLEMVSIARDFLGRIIVQFQSVAGKNYQLEYSNDLVTWAVVIGPTFTNPSAGITQWVDDGTLTGGAPGVKRFYRVRLQ